MKIIDYPIGLVLGTMVIAGFCFSIAGGLVASQWLLMRAVKGGER